MSNFLLQLSLFFRRNSAARGVVVNSKTLDTGENAKGLAVTIAGIIITANFVFFAVD